LASDPDPYLYPGTDTLRNRLGLKDDAALLQAERMLTHARGREAARMSFPLDADGYRALHEHLFQDLYEWAGQDRTVNIGKGGSLFAHAPYVANALSAVFKDLAASNQLQGLSREDFFDRLGHHMNELNAIHPFREGNGRTMRHHATQLAREAGHPFRIAAIDKQAWMEASRHGFTTGDHQPFSAVLAAAHERAEPDQPRTGPGGMAFLPPRDPPTGQRYRLSLTKVRDELDRNLPAARTEAAERLKTLVADNAPPNRIDAARIELAYVRHAKGPVYQSHLLTHLGLREVDAVITAQQTPLERVREIGAALAARINSQQLAQVQRAVRSLERPVLPPGQSPAHDRLAEAFLKNMPDQNRADPRFAGAQAIVDKAHAASQARGDGVRMIEAATDMARTAVAANIRAGKPFDEGIFFSASPAPNTPDRGRTR
jgi:cell filamentation protein